METIIHKYSVAYAGGDIHGWSKGWLEFNEQSSKLELYDDHSMVSYRYLSTSKFHMLRILQCGYSCSVGGYTVVIEDYVGNETLRMQSYPMGCQRSDSSIFSEVSTIKRELESSIATTAITSVEDPWGPLPGEKWPQTTSEKKHQVDDDPFYDDTEVPLTFKPMMNDDEVPLHRMVHYEVVDEDERPLDEVPLHRISYYSTI